MKKSSLSRSLAAVLASTLLLASCGGGGGGTRRATSADFSEAVAGCEVPTQRQFVRTYLDEVYLWYREIPAVDPGQYTTVARIKNYFDDLTNLPKDEFSEAFFTGEQAPVQQLMASAIQPNALLAGHIATSPAYVTTTGGKRAAYVQLKHHLEGAQDELITAFHDIKAQAQPVEELILDLRDNTGGYVYVALTASSMIAGPSKNGQVFERLVFNDKRGETILPFSPAVRFVDQNVTTPPLYPVNTELPQLTTLQRVFILTNDRTCSASESIINSLRGVDVPMVRIGETTCGKPYGFTKKINCGYAFFAIEFQGFNQKGFGDYQAGFAPTCQLSDTTKSNTQLRGTTGDAIYATALAYDTAGCPTGPGTVGIQSSGSPIGSPTRQRPTGASRLLSPEMQPR